ncbi:piggyBac transposable element-derived protein 4 [Trichonephila inaurata madagascariensis]|uniref:PiggyBac transposable element-derived protein 4 n=1 Tax=Trichonephila inaurata madagascariensis TaxID=2747483 RepID=A0A8X6X4E9_9ARAC|nr:piggyBac transposable element-derived protein 4 [Trichonephila inaurata madagascariensis]
MSRKNLPKNLLEVKKNETRRLWSVSNDDIACIKWKDKRIVHILATLDEATKSCEIERKEKDEKKIKIACPEAVIDYNKNMGYVDHFDQLKSMTDLKMLATFQPNANPEDVLIAVPERNLTERDGCALTLMSDYA